MRSTQPANDADHRIAGDTPLAELALSFGPFLTCYLGAGKNLAQRLDRAMADNPAIGPAAKRAAKSACPTLSCDGPVCIVVTGTGRAVTFLMVGQLDTDLVRYGKVPSLGLLVQSASKALGGSCENSAVTTEATQIELDRFLEARSDDRVVQEAAVIGSITSCRATSVLVHDDPMDNRLFGSDRLVDVVTSSALALGIPLTMIPAVTSSHGPLGGVGAIVGDNCANGDVDLRIVQAAAAAASRITPQPASVGPAKSA